ncbi:MAG: esterase-like activity of phytase family protein [Pseudomonadales bacterium]|jgi:hypothetical protein|nr:esterase-like activity of phytase family protein [Pseudomonadales bacterium]MCP5337431.1 esterase-like activity of phytase family protein [Pseudomonadales bacterium]
MRGRTRLHMTLTAAVLAALAWVGGCSGVTQAASGGAPAAVSRFVVPAMPAAGQRVGEVSGLAWDADAQLLYAVSDQGLLYRFRVERAGATLRSVRLMDTAALIDPATGEGQPRAGWRFNAEGLALRPAGGDPRGPSELVVALEERPPQIARFRPDGTLLGRLAVPPPADDSANYRKKGRGLESVALHPAHGLVTAPEAPLQGHPDTLHTVYARGQAWSFVRHTPDSRLKGIEILPDGGLLILERSRPTRSKDEQVATLRRVDLGRCDPQGVCATRLLAALPPGPENFEGLSLLDVHHALIASDNGGQARQGTTFALVTLP